jgi:hypothetical protein
MKKAKCPNCHADVNRFFPERLNLTQKKPWYKPVFIDVRIVCSSCGKFLERKNPDVLLMALISIPIFNSKMYQRSEYGIYLFAAMICYLLYLLGTQLFSEPIYSLSKKQP